MSEVKALKSGGDFAPRILDPNSMRISIAMTSYNGERFIQEQLDSFVSQSRRPDELVVCDDQSTDRTPEILHEFARSSPFPVRVVDNERRLGVTQNFAQAVGLCTGDLIFFSDHDDHWLPEKLAMHEAVHQAEPRVGYVFSNAKICDGAMTPRGVTFFDTQGLTARRRAGIPRGALFDLCIRSPRVPGCTMSFDSSLREVLLPIPSSTLHDVWFCLMLSAFTQVRCIETPLLHYRTHATQACGLHSDAKAAQTAAQAAGNPLEAVLKRVDASKRFFQDALQRAHEHESRLYRKDAVKRLEGKVAHLEARGRLGGSTAARFSTLAREFVNGRYVRFAATSDLVSDVKACCLGG